MTKLILAIETGGTKIQLALGNGQGEILYTFRTLVKKDKGGGGILDEVTKALPLLRQKAKELDGEIWRIGIGFGGPVETVTGTSIWSAQIDGWKNYPIARYFEENTGIPTFLFNDSNAAAWGEYCRGSGRGSRLFFYTNIGSGVGGGVVINGQLFDGQGRGAAEFGQSYMYDPDYQGQSVFKFNHIERICSGWAIQEKMRRDSQIPASSVLWDLCGGEQNKITCELWAKGIQVNDEYCLRILDEEAEYFAIALCNVICFYSPEIIAIGGGVSLIGDPLIHRIRHYVDKYVYENNKGSYKIVQSSLGESIVLVGTLLLTAAQV